MDVARGRIRLFGQAEGLLADRREARRDGDGRRRAPGSRRDLGDGVHRPPVAPGRDVDSAEGASHECRPVAPARPEPPAHR